jgi:ribosome-associated protein
MSKSTPRKRTARTTAATKSPAARKRAATTRKAPTKKSLTAAGEPRPARKAVDKPAEKGAEAAAPAAPTLADYPEQVQRAVAAASAKKAERITVLDLRHTSAFTDVFVVCTGQNARQVKAIVDSVEEALKADGQRPVAVEGYRDSEWVLVDYFDFVVHVFTPETREFYALERLWGSAIRVEVSDEPAARPA